MLMSNPICPYCNQESQFVDSSVIYGKSYGMIYLCSDCDAYVGCHNEIKPKEPLPITSYENSGKQRMNVLTPYGKTKPTVAHLPINGFQKS
jgi:hypothetical protein